MKWTKILPALFALLLFSAAAIGQAPLDPAKLLLQPTDTWPMYNGDYSGRRFSTLAKINEKTVKELQLAWTFRAQGNGGSRGARIEATPLQVNGVIYFTIPMMAWAVDARTGVELWEFHWEKQGGNLIGNRGLAIYKNTLYFETADCNLVALDNVTGKEKWHTPICSLEEMYYSSTAPMVVKDHVIVGVSGDDFDIPGYLESHDLETGKLQWRWYAHPEPGTLEAKTWPNDEAMMHGGGMTWVPGTYDPELNLYYVGTGNAQPVIAGDARPGANLYTGCIVALNPDTGTLVWYFQPNPHDTHDWDAVQTPILFEGTMNGQNRKLLAQASRNGWFFVLDRTNGKALVSTPYTKQNWTKGVNDQGQPIADPKKFPQGDGALVSPNQTGAANWPPPSFSPATGLFYVNSMDAYSEYYVFDSDEKPEGWAGNDRGGWQQVVLRAIDYKTGKVKWSHAYATGASRPGILSTAANLVFTGDTSTNFIAFNAQTGAIVWHAGLGAALVNGPITYMMDGHQYLVVSAGDSIYAFVLP
jgi:acido-empty-quinoprotein group A